MTPKPDQNKPQPYCTCDFSFDQPADDAGDQDGAAEMDMSVRFIGPSTDRCVACGLPKRP